MPLCPPLVLITRSPAHQSAWLHFLWGDRSHGLLKDSQEWRVEEVRQDTCVQLPA